MTNVPEPTAEDMKLIATKWYTAAVQCEEMLDDPLQNWPRRLQSFIRRAVAAEKRLAEAERLLRTVPHLPKAWSGPDSMVCHENCLACTFDEFLKGGKP